MLTYAVLQEFDTSGAHGVEVFREAALRIYLLTYADVC
jgi:hypothetical protein